MNVKHRRGFTLIELLVVIAIIAVLIALLLPAVQQAREAARRSQCKNNMKQIAIALHNYQESFSMFPINGAHSCCTPHVARKPTSWMVMVLPFIDQGPLYETYDFTWSMADDPRGAMSANSPNPSNGWVAQQVVPAYICPSDSHDGRMANNRANISNWVMGVNNYKGVAGGNWNTGVWDVRQHPLNPSPGFPLENTRWGRSSNGLDRGNGIFFRGNGFWYSAKERDIKDGTSTTFMLGEAVPAWCTHTWWAWYNGVTATCAIPLNAPPQCASAAGVTKEQGLFNCRTDWPNNYSFMSRHDGGGHFALCDGSVTFISDNIDRELYRGLSTIQGSETAQVP